MRQHAPVGLLSSAGYADELLPPLAERIYVKKSDGDNSSYNDVGFIGLRALLQKQSPLIGFGITMSDRESANTAYYIYTLVEDEIRRYPILRLGNDVTVISHYECASAITNHFTVTENNVAAVTPVIPENAHHYFFSETEERDLLLSIDTCFLVDGLDGFQNEDSLVINSIFSTLFSAGFITHSNWKNNFQVLIENKNKLEAIASALFALHKAGLLNQITFAAVVKHAAPWECASGLCELTYQQHSLVKTKEKRVKIRPVIFNQVRNSDDALFRYFSPKVQSLYDHLVMTVLKHSFPHEISRAILFVLHAVGASLDLKLLDDIARIGDRFHLTVLGSILFSMLKNNILDSKNCIALLKKPQKHLSMYFAVTDTSSLSEGRLELTQLLFDCIIKFEGDPRVLVSRLAKQTDPAVSVTLFALLARAGSGIKKNLDAFCSRLNDELVIEILAATLAGRDELRQHVTLTESSRFLLGKEISPEILSVVVENKTIAEWLSITTAEEIAEKIKTHEEENEHEVSFITSEKEKCYKQLFNFFSLRRTYGMDETGNRTHSEALQPVLQNLVYGNEKQVKAALEAAKTDLEKLTVLLCGISTVTDYSDRSVTDTLFKAALRFADVEMCQMLKPYFYLIPHGEKELKLQFLEVFPNGLDADILERRQNTFNFDPIFKAIDEATPQALDAELKNKSSIPFFAALRQFQQDFADHARKEKTFNPNHLLSAYELFLKLLGRYSKESFRLALYDGRQYELPDYKKALLSWKKIVGCVQRFVPACYAQAFAQGLENFFWVEDVHYASAMDNKIRQFGISALFFAERWKPQLLDRSLELQNVMYRDSGLFFFPLNGSLNGNRLGVDFAISIFRGKRSGEDGKIGYQIKYDLQTLEELVSQKETRLSKLVKVPALTNSGKSRPYCCIM